MENNTAWFPDLPVGWDRNYKEKEWLVYVAKREDKLVKIGITSNSIIRKKAIECTSGYCIEEWYESTRLKNKRDANMVENKAHQYFHAMRKNGEWFECIFVDAINLVKREVGDLLLISTDQEETIHFKAQITREETETGQANLKLVSPKQMEEQCLKTRMDKLEEQVNQLKKSPASLPKSNSNKGIRSLENRLGKFLNGREITGWSDIKNNFHHRFHLNPMEEKKLKAETETALRKLGWRVGNDS